jgi:hypothetical protein
VPKPFDTTLKDLFSQHPSDLAPLLGLGSTPLRSLPTNLVANLDTDLVLGFGDPLQGVIDLNFQGRWDEDTLCRVLCYNALLYRQHRVPIHSAVMLLKSRENDLRLDRGVQYSMFPGRGRMDFLPEPIRLWEQPLETMLSSSVGLMPLAPLAAMPEGISITEAMPEIIRRINQRLESEASPEQANRIRVWTYTLSGIHLTPGEIRDLIRQEKEMVLGEILKESSFLVVLEEFAKCKWLREQILRRGRLRFGPVGDEPASSLEGIEDLSRLERMLDATFSANSWDEVMATA